MNREQYKQYLQTSHWQDVRNRFWNSKLEKLCHICKSDKDLNIHHKTYNRIGKEKLNDLIPLCRDCHKLTHQFLQYKKSSNSSRINLSNAARKLKLSLGLRKRKIRNSTPSKQNFFAAKFKTKKPIMNKLRFIQL